MLYQFPTPFVFFTKINNHEEVNERVLREINERSGQEAPGWTICNTVTSIHNTPKYNEFLKDPFYAKNILWDPLDQMILETRGLMGTDEITPVSYEICNCWYNKYDKGAFQEIHNHVGESSRTKEHKVLPAYSVAYIAALEGENTTVFTQAGPVLGLFGSERLSFDTRRVSDIEAGTVIIFPFYLDHYVLPALTNGRVTLTYNISASYTMSS